MKRLTRERTSASDGIKIIYEEERQFLSLVCEPDAFVRYRELARENLADLPEINVDEVVELVIVDFAALEARRDAPKKRLWEMLGVGIFLVILALAVIGVVSTIRWVVP
ncbi:MAG: hypothetical protein WEB58_16590 [Planctomycetaceae bacterium]